MAAATQAAAVVAAAARMAAVRTAATTTAAMAAATTAIRAAAARKANRPVAHRAISTTKFRSDLAASQHFRATFRGGPFAHVPPQPSRAALLPLSFLGHSL